MCFGKPDKKRDEDMMTKAVTQCVVECAKAGMRVTSMQIGGADTMFLETSVGKVTINPLPELEKEKRLPRPALSLEEALTLFMLPSEIISMKAENERLKANQAKAVTAIRHIAEDLVLMKMPLSVTDLLYSVRDLLLSGANKTIAYDPAGGASLEIDSTVKIAVIDEDEAE